MFNNFFKNNKGKLIGTALGPAGMVAGGAYDLYNRFKKSKSKPKATSGEWQGPLQPAKPTYTSKKARTGYNNAVSDLNAYKQRQSSSKSNSFDPLANINQLETKKKRRDDDDDEDDGPSPMERYLREVQQIQAGKFKYSSTEKKNLENLRATGRNLELRQSRVNDNYEGGTLQNELRSGRSRYAQEIADDAMINAMQYGVDQINEIDLETQKGIVELEESIKEERLRAVAEKYGLLQEQDRQREDVTQNIQKNLLDYQKLQATIQNQSRGSVENDYNLAISQGYRGSYRDFLREQESNKLAGKYAPRASSSSNSGSSTAQALTAFLNS